MLLPPVPGAPAFRAGRPNPPVMGSAVVSRWSRRFVAAGTLFLLAWSVAALGGLGRRVEVTLVLFGFVLHTVFGKGYALIPTYFDRTVAFARAPTVQLPLSAVGAAAIAASGLPGVPAWLLTAGAVAWGAGVVVFVGTLAWTVRDNPTGAETGTGEHNARRRWLDRVANAAVPVVLAYLLAGSYEVLAGTLGLPTLLDGSMARVSHLLGAGVATLLVVAVGFRLFPRFLGAHPPRALAGGVVLTAAVGPALIAAGLYDGALLHAGAAVEAVAVAGFAVTYGILFARSDRRRLGLATVGIGCLAGVLTVALGLSFAVAARLPALVAAHYRLALAGFLGLTIVGATYQFYPPDVGEWPLAGETAATLAVAVLACGLVLQLAGPIAGPLVSFGLALAVLGAALHCYVVWAVLAARPV